MPALMMTTQLAVEVCSSVAPGTNTNQHIVSRYEPFQMLLIATVPTFT
jgi:hypothetical protein